MFSYKQFLVNYQVRERSFGILLLILFRNKASFLSLRTSSTHQKKAILIKKCVYFISSEFNKYESILVLNELAVN